MFQAFVSGYEEHLFDLKCLSVYVGYWTGYFSNAKKPKSLSSILSSLVREHTKARRVEKSTEVARPEVDVEAFLKQEERLRVFKQRR